MKQIHWIIFFYDKLLDLTRGTERKEKQASPGRNIRKWVLWLAGENRRNDNDSLGEK